MLGINIATLPTWMAIDTPCEVRFECHKKFWLSSLYTNWVFDEMIKSPIQ